MGIYAFNSFYRRIDILPGDCTEEKKKQLKYAYEVSYYFML